MIDCLVFSKDRPMQLDALLQSVDRYAAGVFELTVLYRATDPRFDLGYVDCLRGRGVHVLREQGFRGQVLDWLDAAGSRVCFLVDDDVFYQDIHDQLANQPSRVIASLRLGSNTTHCYPTGREQTPPPSSYGWLCWEWRNQTDDFAYPLSLDGHIISKTYLVPLLDFDFSNPTELEAGLAGQADHLLPATTMVATAESCLVSIPANRVSDSGGNRHWARPDYTPERLNDLFLDGYRVHLESMDFSSVTAAHQEIELKFMRSRGRLAADASTPV